MAADPDRRRAPDLVPRFVKGRKLFPPAGGEDGGMHRQFRQVDVFTETR